MNTHDYCVHTIGKIIMELERCARASISTIKMLEQAGRYTTEQAKETVAHQSTLHNARQAHFTHIRQGNSACNA